MKPIRFPALAVIAASLALTAATAQAQKPATGQQKLKERVDALEVQLKDAQAKADRAAIEKDYIERVQKQYESYYEKVLSAQTTSLTILGITLTAVFTFGGLYSLKVFDDRTKNAIAAAVTELEAKLNEKTQAAAEKLRKENAGRSKQLEDDLEQRINKMVAKLEHHTTIALCQSQVITLTEAKRYTDARSYCRYALEIIAKNPETFTTQLAQGFILQLFYGIKLAAPQNFIEEAEKELAADLYKKFENELNAAAIEISDLVPILKKRKDALPSLPKP